MGLECKLIQAVGRNGVQVHFLQRENIFGVGNGKILKAKFTVQEIGVQVGKIPVQFSGNNHRILIEPEFIQIQADNITVYFYGRIIFVVYSRCGQFQVGIRIVGIQVQAVRSALDVSVQIHIPVTVTVVIRFFYDSFYIGIGLVQIKTPAFRCNLSRHYSEVFILNDFADLQVLQVGFYIVQFLVFAAHIDCCIDRSITQC